MRRPALTEAMVREAIHAEGFVYKHVTHAGGRTGFTTHRGVDSSGDGRPIADKLGDLIQAPDNERFALVVPAATGAGWFHEYCAPREVRFLRGRIRFEGEKSGAPFPSAVVIVGRAQAVGWWDIRAGTLNYLPVETRQP